MRRELSISQNRIVPLNRVCTLAGVARSSVYYARQANQVEQIAPGAPRGPRGGHTDEQLVAHIRAVLAASPFLGEGYRKVWAKLRVRDIRTSRARVLRLMREHGLRAPTRSGGPRGPRSHEGTIIPPAPDMRWGTDLTGTWTTRDGSVSVLLTVDHHTAEILGIHATKRATRWEALEPVRQAVRRCFGAIRERIAAGVELRHDHGSQYMSDDFQDEIDFLGLSSSPAFVRAPEGNGCVERAIRTLKEQLLWVKTFETIEELRLALLAWAQIYNEHWLIERHGFKPPAQRRREYYAEIQQLAA
jgi:putative transposase